MSAAEQRSEPAGATGLVLDIGSWWRPGGDDEGSDSCASADVRRSRHTRNAATHRGYDVLVTLTRTDSQEVLVRAAEAEITENGIGALSLRAIARRAGVSHQTPGFHFRDRAGLLTALAIDGFVQLTKYMRQLQDELTDDATAIMRVGAVGIAYVTFADSHPAMFSVMVRGELQHENDPELAEAQVECFSVLVRAIQAAQAEGWGAEHPTDTLALLCWTAVHGIATLWRDGGVSTFYPDLTLEEVTDRIIGTVAVALGPAR